MKQRTHTRFFFLTAHVLLLTWAVACTGDPQQASQRYVASGDAYLAEVKLAEAIIEYRNAVQQDPLSFEARNKLGEASGASWRSRECHQCVCERSRPAPRRC